METPTINAITPLEEDETQAADTATNQAASPAPSTEEPSNKVQELLELTEAEPTLESLDWGDASMAFEWDLLGNFLILLALCAVTAHLLERVYRRCGFSLSNRSDFSRNFVLLACTTMMIIAMVKSALAISIGLLGALSIVRFRAAIKEPEELCYLFLAIGLGVGFGASVGLGFLTPEPYITLITFAFLTSILFIRRQFTTADVGGDYHLLVASKYPEQVGHGAIQQAVLKHTKDAALKRLDQSQDILEANYQVHFAGPEQLEECRKSLLGLGEGLSVSLMDNRGLGN
ncbi:DUF4956 domain-containing protein [Verrucomicrobiales bacterium]|nr:DUF4956 domain-containing protein [Verrucomicrobiales bacterium]